MITGIRTISKMGLLAALAMSTVACSGSYGDSPTGPGETTNAIAVRDDFFDPSSTTVGPGDRVTWTWQGSNEHNITWTSANLTDSATQSSGSHSVAMPAVGGAYVYYCTIHGTPNSGMRGTVNVDADRY